MGTRHLNLLFFLPEGENPFPSQPFLKRNFDLLNPEVRVFISSPASVCTPALCVARSQAGRAAAAPLLFSFAAPTAPAPRGPQAGTQSTLQGHPHAPKITVT